MTDTTTTTTATNTATCVSCGGPLSGDAWFFCSTACELEETEDKTPGEV